MSHRTTTIFAKENLLRTFALGLLLGAFLAVSAPEAAAQRAGGGRTFYTGPLEYTPPEGVKLIPDVNYREGSDIWRIDIAIPEDPSAAPRAAILNIHGGGWTGGDKYGGRGIICHWAAEGFVGVGVRYHLLGEAPFPACVEDVKNVVRFLRANAKEYNIDPNRIGAFGHSAGAHLAVCLGVIPDSAGLDVGPYLDQSSVVNAVCAISAPTNMFEGKEAGRFNGDLELAKKVSPITYANENAPPYLLIHGTLDNTVPISNATSFIAALREKGAKNADLVILDGLGHDSMPSHEAFLLPMVDNFFETTIGDRAGTFQYQTDLAKRWLAERNQGFGIDKVADMDANKDGKIQQSEWKGTQEMFARIDKGTDNVITDEEMLSFKRDAAARGARGGARGAAPQNAPADAPQEAPRGGGAPQ